jgi:hypothetical protein
MYSVKSDLQRRETPRLGDRLDGPAIDHAWVGNVNAQLILILLLLVLIVISFLLWAAF